MPRMAATALAPTASAKTICQSPVACTSESDSGTSMAREALRRVQHAGIGGGVAASRNSRCRSREEAGNLAPGEEDQSSTSSTNITG